MDADDFSNENGSLVLTLIDLATQDTMYLMVVHYCIAAKIRNLTFGLVLMSVKKSDFFHSKKLHFV